jgi:thiol-disulfide isomerase/thioredoxin
LASPVIPSPIPDAIAMRAALLTAFLAILTACGARAEAPITTSVPKPMPELRFQDLEGAEAGLDLFRGQVVVLNLWATWCAPCREEMPSLVRLQEAFEGEPVRVIALSVDRAGPDRVKAFLDEIGAANLSIYRDPTVKAARTLKVPGLPATLLIDREGREVGRVLGLARWDGDAAITAVRRLLGATPDVVRTGFSSAPP